MKNRTYITLTLLMASALASCTDSTGHTTAGTQALLGAGAGMVFGDPNNRAASAIQGAEMGVNANNSGTTTPSQRFRPVRTFQTANPVTEAVKAGETVIEGH